MFDLRWFSKGFAGDVTTNKLSQSGWQASFKSWYPSSRKIRVALSEVVLWRCCLGCRVWARALETFR